jgi:hypothetical protein
MPMELEISKRGHLKTQHGYNRNQFMRFRKSWIQIHKRKGLRKTLLKCKFLIFCRNQSFSLGKKKRRKKGGHSKTDKAK